MYLVLDKIEAVKKAIEIVISKNRHVFSVDDIELLESCLDELEKLKEEVLKAKGLDDESLTRLVRIMKLLDLFFGLGNNIIEFFKDVN